MPYVQIDRDTGKVFKRRDSILNIDNSKQRVWVPVQDDDPPAFNPLTHRLVKSTAASPMPFQEGVTTFGARWTAVALSVPEKVAVVRRNRKEAYIAQLGEDADFENTVGDILDDLIAEIVAIRAGTPQTQAFTDLLAKVGAIKAANPKP